MYFNMKLQNFGTRSNAVLLITHIRHIKENAKRQTTGNVRETKSLNRDWVLIAASQKII